MPKFLEEKLKKEYPDDPAAPYKVMNAKGFMHGNKETAKGRAADAKHARDTAAKSKAKSSKRAPSRPSSRDDAGLFSGPAGPFGSLSRAPRQFRKNAPDLAGRRADSRLRYQS